MTEPSAASSRPVECYRFVVSGYPDLLLTSDEMGVTAESLAYVPQAGLSRSDSGIAVFGDSSTLTVTVPAASLLAQRVGLFSTPQSVMLHFRRYQRSDLDTPVIRFDGKMDSASIRGNQCTLKFPDAFSSGLGTSIPKNRIQTQCNWNLGDSNCGVDLALFTANVDDIAEVAAFGAVQPGQYTVQASWVDGVTPYNPERWLGGVITGTYEGVVERRTIFEHYFIGANPFQLRARLVLNRGFDIPLAFSTFTITPGCDNSFARCSEFGNTPRFGGFQFVPTERLNPFRIRLDKKRKL